MASGYNRVVHGERGSYIEFEKHHLYQTLFFTPDTQKWRMTPYWKERVFYYEMRSTDDSYIKLYIQRKTVDYADYKIGKCYISVDALAWEGELRTS